MSTPLDELERLKAECDTPGHTFQTVGGVTRDFIDAMVRHADWLLTQAREAAEMREQLKLADGDESKVAEFLREMAQDQEDVQTVAMLLSASIRLRLQSQMYVNDARYWWLRQDPGATGWTIENGMGDERYGDALYAAIDSARRKEG